jgi:D-alanyl-D-alanine carboxypeptidase/D-alanyl-D-alanine-endopeptidase (penicillin-binding protein 4)
MRLHAIQCQIIMRSYLSTRILPPFLTCLLLFGLLISGGCIENSGPGPKDGQSAVDCDFSTITGTPIYAHASWGILVVDPQTDEVLYERNADEMFVPASTTKLFTSAAVLESLGPDYRFITPVYAIGTVDRTGILEGDLVLVASGDPDMGGRMLPDGSIEFTNVDHGDANALGGAILTATDPLAGLDSLALQVRATGITEVSDVVIDDRLFETTDLGKGFVVSPIIVNDNLVDVIITPGAVGTAPSLAMRPQTAAYRLVNEAVTGPAGNPLGITITDGAGETIVVRGCVAADAGRVNQTYSVKTPASYARTLFIEALARHGVHVGAPATGENPSEKLPETGTYADAKEVARITSPPLTEDVKLTLKVSQNLHADTYISLIAAASNKTGFYDGLIKEGEILRSMDIDTAAVSLGDGEGGVEEDRFSPRSAAQLLTIVTTRPYSEEFTEALPVLGVDGSLASSCTAGNPARGYVYAKTGTHGTYDPLNDRGILLTKSLAGYVDTASGKRLIFAVFVNNVPFLDVQDMYTVGEDLGSIAGLIYTHY